MLGIYISVPFCKSKCSYCNFASGVFSRDRMQRYVDRVVEEMEAAPGTADAREVDLVRAVDSIYLGGGTPSTLAPGQLQEIFAAVRRNFDVESNAEITVECAPGTLSPDVIATLMKNGVNRVSLGVQSFNDLEAKSVGRLHTSETTFADITRLRQAGIHNINVDLIAGLPHQTAETWEDSLAQTIATGVPHVSVYILEVDEDSRLGRELIAGGQRYHAHHVPDSDLVADLYDGACERLNEAGIHQYEISNFASTGTESRHNLKYWTRRPYLGFGLDAHSMLYRRPNGRAAEPVALRFSNSDDLEAYLDRAPATTTGVTLSNALEEELFLGLRLNRGVDVSEICARSDVGLPESFQEAIRDIIEQGLLGRSGGQVALTPRGRLLANEVFVRFVDHSPES
jgi:oxygen-independent coproporphyrinogen III oxidase